jgi:predicted small lipoprotein YifL
MKCWRMIVMIVVAASLTTLTACGIGTPMDIPVPESELGPEPGALTGPSGEWVIYRKQ